MRKKTILSVTCENERISIKKKQLTLHEMRVASLLCGSYCKRFSLYILGIPAKENGRKFAPTASIASKFRLGNT